MGDDLDPRHRLASVVVTLPTNRSLPAYGSCGVASSYPRLRARRTIDGMAPVTGAQDEDRFVRRGDAEPVRLNFVLPQGEEGKERARTGSAAFPSKASSGFLSQPRQCARRAGQVSGGEVTRSGVSGLNALVRSGSLERRA